MSMFSVDRFSFDNKTATTSDNTLASVSKSPDSEKENKPAARNLRKSRPQEVVYEEELSIEFTNDDEQTTKTSSASKSKDPVSRTSTNDVTDDDDTVLEEKMNTLLEFFPQLTRKEALEVIGSTSTLHGAVTSCLLMFNDKKDGSKKRKKDESSGSSQPSEPDDDDDDDDDDDGMSLPSWEKQQEMVRKLKKEIPEQDKSAGVPSAPALAARMAPGGRERRFSPEEIDLLTREVKSRETAIYGDGKAPPKQVEVKQAWEEVAAIITSSSGITRTARQCRKRYCDVKRRGKQRVVAYNQSLAAGGGPATSQELTPAEDTTTSTFSPLSIKGFGGLEVGGPDPGEGASGQERGKGETRGEGSTRGHPARRRSRQATALQEDHPFLQLQQNGFHMLQGELGGLRRSVQQLNNHLSRLEVQLRPLRDIATSLGRLADAAEHRRAPPSPPATDGSASPPPQQTFTLPSNRTRSRARLAPSAPGPSGGRLRHGAPHHCRLRARGGRR